MNTDNVNLEDDLRPEYDLRGLKVRKIGHKRNDLRNKYMINLEKEIDILVNHLGNYFASKRTKVQSHLIYLQKNTNWKLHRRYFQIGIVICLFLFFVLLRSTVDVSKNPLSQNHKIFGIILLFSTLFSLLGAMILISFDQFASVWQNFTTYQDEIIKLGEAVKKNLRSNNLIIQTDVYRKLKCSPDKYLIDLVKSHFEFRVRVIEKNSNVIEPFSYLLSLSCLFFIFLVYGLPELISSLLSDPKNYSILISMLLFSISIVQSIFKMIAFGSGNSIIKKHQECLLLLKNMESALHSD